VHSPKFHRAEAKVSCQGNAVPDGQISDMGPACNKALEPLGLRLELKRRPVEMLVIDHVEKTPTEN
jgi:uncharacterized protein (TIGR03435 family)